MTRCRLIIALLGVIWISSFSVQAANPVPVVVKVLPGANLSLITNLLGGTLIDTMPEANTVLLRLPGLPVLSPILKLLGVEWMELDRGVSLPVSGQLRLLDVLNDILDLQSSTIPDNAFNLLINFSLNCFPAEEYSR